MSDRRARLAAELIPPPEPAQDVRILIRENKALKERLLRGQGVEDLIVQQVAECFDAPSPVPRPPRVKAARGRGEEEAALQLTDTQIGKRTPSYDHVVAAERIIHAAKVTVEITNLRRKVATIRRLNLFLTGDMVEHECLFGSQPHHISISLLDQATNHGPAIIRGVLEVLAPEFDEVLVYCVPGNHGRSGSHGGPQNEHTNWDRVFYRVAKLMTAHLTNVKWEISDGFYLVARTYRWGHLLVHGDQIRGGFAGFPWYGAAKKAWGWIDSISEPWDYLWFGHFHTPATAVLNYRTMLAGGTTESGNAYAQEQLAAAGWPQQRLAFFNDKHGLICDTPIYLSDRSPASERGTSWK